MARVLSYVLTALIAGVIGAQLATPEARSRVRRANPPPDVAVERPRPKPALPQEEPERKPPQRSEPLPADQLAARAEAEKRGVIPPDEAARDGYMELVRRNLTRAYDEAGRRLVIAVERFEGADSRLAGALGNSWLGSRRVTIQLERTESGKVRVLDPDRGRREGLRIWADLEFEEEQLPPYLAPYRAYVPR